MATFFSALIVFVTILTLSSSSRFVSDDKWWDQIFGDDESKSFDFESFPSSTFDFNRRLGQRRSDEREREAGEEEAPFDPSIVIVDKGSSSPELPSNNRKNHFDDFFKELIPDVSFRSAWWKGPNVCVDRKEIDEGTPKNRTFTFNFETTSCKETDTSYICTKKIENNEESKTYVVKKQCCYGYKRQDSKCVEFELKELVPLMKDLGATHFVELLSSTQLLDLLQKDNFTVFCPVNDAVIDFEEGDEDNDIPKGRIVRSTSTKNIIVSGHLVEGYITSEDFEKNQMLTSVNGETGIRMNMYSGMLMKPFFLPNCAKIIGMNNYATNGVVHLIDRMLPIPTKTVLNIITSNNQLTILKGILSQANMVETLNDPKGTYTVFAPVDSAFKQMDSEVLRKMQKGEGCVSSLVKNHISPHVICSSALTNVGYVSNLLNRELKMVRDENDKLFVNDVQIVGYDIVGTNGVVHIIEDVLIPEEAQTLTETLKKSERWDLMDLIDAAGLREEMDSWKNFTFFAPSKFAIKRAEKKEELENSTEKMREFILSHVAAIKVKTCNFSNNQLLPSVVDEDATFRVNRFDVIPGFAHHYTLQCVPLVNVNHGVCQGAIHVVYETISPSKSKIVQTLEKIEGIDTFVRLLKESGLAETLEEEGPFTVLAPNDEAFEKMKDKSVLEDKEQLRNLLKLHILSETMCCAGIRSSLGFYVRQLLTTLNGTEIPAQRSVRGVKFSSSRVTQCDIMAKNGVIHLVNRVIQPPKQHVLDFSELIREMFV